MPEVSWWGSGKGASCPATETQGRWTTTG
jgi:hypothetical protein